MATGGITLERHGDHGFMASVSHLIDRYTIRVEPPAGQTLGVGTFATKRFADATHGALVVSGNNEGCDTYTGSVTIHEVVRDVETGDLTSVALTYQQAACLPVKGEFRWKSARGYTAATSTSRWAGFGSAGAGVTSPPKTITFRAYGDAPLEFGKFVIAGAHPGSFAITNDGCSGTTLAENEVCSISVVTTPQGLDTWKATLEAPSNTAGGKETVDLEATGVISNLGTYYPLISRRILDTRAGIGAPTASLRPGQKIDLLVAGRGGVPGTGVSAVVLNVTVTAPTTSGHVTVWPAGLAMPVASSLNFTKGWTGANSVTVAVGAGGNVSLYNSAGNTHLIADVIGWYADDSPPASWGPGGLLHPVTAHRRFDSRTWQYGKLDGGEYVQLLADFGQEANRQVWAWAVNITSTESGNAGYLTAWNGDPQTLPNASTLNYTPGQTVSNFAIVPARQCAECPPEFAGASSIGVYSSGTTHVIVDMFAVFDDGSDTTGLRLKPTTPTRIADSRIGQATPSALGPASATTITAPGSLLDENTSVLALNVTAVAPTANTFITVWPSDMTQPTVSNLNPDRGQIIPNAVITTLDGANAFNVYNNAGNTHFVIDVVETYFWYPFGHPPRPVPGGNTADMRSDSPLGFKPGAGGATVHRLRH